MIWISVSVLIICFPISIFLWRIILKYLSHKPILSLTLVDLIYRDIIVCLFLMFFVYSIALTHALTAGTDKLTLSYELSLMYVVMLNFLTNCIHMLMLICGGMRFISLVKNSEAAGLQLLGVDTEAVIIIRLVSIIISIIIPGTIISLCDAYPGTFRLLHEEKISSNWEDIKENKCVAIYLILPDVTVLFNVIVVCYSSWIKRQMKKRASSLTIIKDSLNVDKFTFSITQVTIIPFLIFISLLQSFSERRIRLMFHGPFHVFLINVLLPTTIICINKKIKYYFQRKYLEPVIELHRCAKIHSLNKVLPLNNA